MLISLVLASHIAVASPWVKLRGIDSLIDRLDKPGVVAVCADGFARVLTAEGEEVEKLPIPTGALALFYSSEGLATYPNIPPIQISPDRKAAPLHWSQGYSLLCLSQGVTVRTEKSVFAYPIFDRYSAIAVRPDGAEICVLTNPMGVPVFARFSSPDQVYWAANPDLITPQMSPGVFATPIPRFNDLRYISTDSVAFIGIAYDSSSGPKESSILSPSEVAIPPFVLEKSRGAPARAYLAVTNLRTRVTHVRRRLECDSSGEPGGPRFGRLSVSSDSRYLFLFGPAGIERFDIESLLGTGKPHDK